MIAETEESTFTFGSILFRIIVIAAVASRQVSISEPMQEQVMLPETSMAIKNFLPVGLALAKLISKLWSKAGRRAGGRVDFSHLLSSVACARRSLNGWILPFVKASWFVSL